jgi:IS4 transposase
MNQGKMTFSQLMEFASQDSFKRCVERYKGNHRVKDFSCWKQFLCLAFGQLTHRESMSDTLLCLGLNSDKLYHLGIGKIASKSTLSRANESRDWRIFQDFALRLIDQANKLYSKENQLDVELKGRIFALDSTTVDLCLDVFWWASFRSTKAAVKVHTLLDLKTSLPEFIVITNGDVHDVNILDELSIQKNSYYVMDKAYIDFKRLNRIHDEKAFFVVRAKENFQGTIVKSYGSDVHQGVLKDTLQKLNGYQSRRNYPSNVRVVEFYDIEQHKKFTFLTNNLKIKATTVAQLYKHRWYVELFFKWIKQNLKIKSFWGQNENAVRIQIWVAISVYVLVAIARKQLSIEHSLYELLQYVSLAPFEKRPLHEVFQDLKISENSSENYIQLKINLF